MSTQLEQFLNAFRSRYKFEFPKDKCIAVRDIKWETNFSDIDNSNIYWGIILVCPENEKLKTGDKLYFCYVKGFNGIPMSDTPWALKEHFYSDLEDLYAEFRVEYESKKRVVNRISPEEKFDPQRVYDFFNNRIPAKAEGEKVSEKVPEEKIKNGIGQYVAIPFSKLENTEWWRKLSTSDRNIGNLLPLYMIIRRYVVRREDKIGLYKHFYQNKGKLVASINQQKLRDIFGYGAASGEKSIKEKIKHLEKIKALEVRRWRHKEKVYKIYVLGKIKSGKESWYIDRI